MSVNALIDAAANALPVGIIAIPANIAYEIPLAPFVAFGGGIMAGSLAMRVCKLVAPELELRILSAAVDLRRIFPHIQLAGPFLAICTFVFAPTLGVAFGVATGINHAILVIHDIYLSEQRAKVANAVAGPSTQT
jgi:hypothetical protein